VRVAWRAWGGVGRQQPQRQHAATRPRGTWLRPHALHRQSARWQAGDPKGLTWRLVGVPGPQAGPAAHQLEHLPKLQALAGPEGNRDGGKFSAGRWFRGAGGGCHNLHPQGQGTQRRGWGCSSKGSRAMAACLHVWRGSDDSCAGSWGLSSDAADSVRGFASMQNAASFWVTSMCRETAAVEHQHGQQSLPFARHKPSRRVHRQRSAPLKSSMPARLRMRGCPCHRLRHWHWSNKALTAAKEARVSLPWQS
jgi:hypothetical protein